MKEQKIYDEDGDGYYKIWTGTDVEFKNPIEYHSNNFISIIMSIEKDLVHANFPDLILPSDQDIFLKRATEQWEEREQKILDTEVPEAFLKLLECTKKRDQIKLLRGQSISSDQLMAYIFKAWSSHGYSFSQYKSEHNHEGLDESKLPQLINIKDEKVITIGETKLTDGELKNVVNHRKVTIAKFLDRNEEWHCFFGTYRSLNGKEAWQDEQPHYHYLSDKWGRTREETVERLKSKNYPSTNVHIPFIVAPKA
ncbi:MAG: hypothetical protein ACRBFS_26470 [Aureispira sp.]